MCVYVHTQRHNLWMISPIESKLQEGKILSVLCAAMPSTSRTPIKYSMTICWRNKLNEYIILTSLKHILVWQDVFYSVLVKSSWHSTMPPWGVSSQVPKIFEVQVLSPLLDFPLPSLRKENKVLKPSERLIIIWVMSMPQISAHVCSGLDLIWRAAEAPKAGYNRCKALHLKPIQINTKPGYKHCLCRENTISGQVL